MGTVTELYRRLTVESWKAMSREERAELIVAIDEVGEAVVVGLERAGLVIEEHAPGHYVVRPA